MTIHKSFTAPPSPTAILVPMFYNKCNVTMQVRQSIVAVNGSKAVEYRDRTRNSWANIIFYSKQTGDNY